MTASENPAVTRFREFLRIKTVQPQPDYAKCTEFLSNQAKELGLKFEEIELVKGKPIVLLTWAGNSPELKGLMLNCHTDVVPVFEDKWNHPAFDAVKLENGDIIARGSQDMKCVGSWYLEAVRKLKFDLKFSPMRNIYLIFVPDEEIGGHDGMEKFVLTQKFKSLNVGFVMDEGLASENDHVKLYYGERAPWWISIKASGNVGHGSQFIPNTASKKIQAITDRLLKFRDSEELRLKIGKKEDGRPFTLGDVTTLNYTMMKGGVQYNVVPDEMEVGFDVRISPSVDLTRFKHTIREWCKECGCELTSVQERMNNSMTKMTDDNVWWRVIRDKSAKLGWKIDLEIFPAATDSRYVRDSGIPAIGISPIRNTKILLHDHNEYLNEKVFLDGIDWYVDVLQGLSEVSAEYDKNTNSLLTS